MPEKTLPSETDIIIKYNAISLNGKFYVEEEHYNELYKKYDKARRSASYYLDKWFFSIENRMRDQDRVMTATSRYERAVNKISALEKELRELNKTIHELKMEIAKPQYRVEHAGQQVCCSKEFKTNFGGTIPAFPDFMQPPTEEPLPGETPEEFNDRTGYYDLDK